MTHRQKRIGIIVLTAVLALIAGIMGTLLLLRPPSAQTALPESIRSQITFSPLVTTEGSTYQSGDYKVGSNESGAQILSFHIITPQQTKVVVTEQALPQEFTDIPEYKDKFLENKKDDTVATASGTINLFRATKQDNKIAGVMIERGLLIFLNPESPLSKDEWRNLGDQLELQRVE